MTRGYLPLWLVTRLIAALILAAPRTREIGSDVFIFADWADQLARGNLPADAMWQYPPGTALVLAPIGVLRLGPPGVIGLILLADYAILRLLRESPGARLWAWSALLIGPVLLVRLDTVVTACAVAGLLSARAARSGAWLAAGASLKLWPAILLMARSVLSRIWVRPAPYVTVSEQAL